MATDWYIVAAALVIIALTHCLGGITAYGSTLMAFPALVWVVDFQTARTVLLTLGTLQAALVFANARRHADWREIGRMVLIAGLGLPFGVAAAAYLPVTPLLATLGIVLIASGAYRLRHPDDTGRWPKPVLFCLLLVGGLIHGAFATGGTTLVLYLQNTTPAKDRFRGTLSGFWVVVNSVLIITMLIRDGISPASAGLLLGAVPVVILISWLANRVAHRLSQKHFIRLVAGLLIFAGVVTMAKTIANPQTTRESRHEQ